MDLFGTRRRQIAQLKAWAEAHAIVFDDLDHADPERLAPLDSLVRGKRLVFLGEGDHFVHEVFAFRLLMLRYLVKRGFRWVGEEVGVCDGLRIDRYLQTGQETWLHRLPSFGCRDGLRADRNDALTGLLDASRYPSEAMRAEHAELARALRRVTKGPERPRWFGLDGDNAPGGAYEDVERLMAKGGKAARALLSAMARVPGETLDEEVARLGDVLSELTLEAIELEAEVGAEATAQARRSLMGLREGLVFVRDTGSASSWQEVSAPLARREAAMIEQARSALAAVAPGQGAVLLGHAAHLTRDWPSARLLDKGAGPPPATLGTLLAREDPDAVFAIWLLHASGKDSQPIESLPRDLTLAKGTLNEALAQVGRCFLAPLAGAEPLPALLRDEQEVRWIYNGGCRAVLPRQVDAIFFVEQASPLREDLRLGGGAA